MRETLLSIERILPTLLQDEAAWNGLFIGTEKPHLRRLWRQHGDLRIYLHRFEGCLPEEAFAHPHPWPLAVRILRGRYRMTVGASDNLIAPPDIVSVDLLPGCLYEMTHQSGWHRIFPLDEACDTLMVAGPTEWPENRRVGNQPTRPLEPVERTGMFQGFRAYYPLAA